jgi:hypothetical protein
MAKPAVGAMVLPVIALSAPASAQIDAPPIPDLLPKVASISVANAAGVLNYCVKNNLVSFTAVDQVVTGLSAKPDPKSADYVDGQGGQIHADGGKTFAMTKAPAILQSQACDRVLQQAKTFK